MVQFSEIAVTKNITHPDTVNQKQGYSAPSSRKILIPGCKTERISYLKTATSSSVGHNDADSLVLGARTRKLNYAW